MESWSKVFSQGFAKVMSTVALKALMEGLRVDSAGLLQGATTSPPPLTCVQDYPVEAACAIGFAGWRGEVLFSVGEVEEYFARTCHQVDQLFDEPAACRHFLNWVDETPRDEMRLQLLPLIRKELGIRNVNGSTTRSY